jgi:hypothetical protein
MAFRFPVASKTISNPSTVVAREAVAGPSDELHEVALTFLDSRYDCLTNDRIVRAWTSAAR